MSTRESLLAQVKSHVWNYSFDLGDGVTTPGRFGPANAQIMQAFDKVDFRGKSVLDIGCWEGQWSFEAEKRGAASVLATDYLIGDPRAQRNEQGVLELPTFRLAHTILGSRVDYRPDVSVNRITRLDRRDFDVVNFCGVYYHLKNPLLALTGLREVIREGGTLIVEGPVVEGPAEAYARFFYYDVLSEDRSNWWVPTVSCLVEWIECSYFEVLSVSDPSAHEVRSIGAGEAPGGGPKKTVGKETVARRTVLARAVARKDWRYVLPDEDLEKYDRG